MFVNRLLKLVINKNISIHFFQCYVRLFHILNNLLFNIITANVIQNLSLITSTKGGYFLVVLVFSLFVCLFVCLSVCLSVRPSVSQQDGQITIRIQDPDSGITAF